MGKDFTVTVNGERGEEFKQVFGTNTVHVLLPFPYMAKLEGHPDSEPIYMLDSEALTAEQHDRLVTHLARKFSSSEVEIRRYLRNEGLPIRAADTVVTVANPQKWLLDDEPARDPEDTEQVEPMSDLDDSNVISDLFGGLEGF